MNGGSGEFEPWHGLWLIPARGFLQPWRRMSSNPEEEGVLRSPAGFADEIAEYETMVRQAVSSGQLLTAIEVAKDGLHRFPDNLLLRQQLALAQTQAGALDAAEAVLEELVKESPKDEETLSLLGRIHKELWRRATNPDAGAAALQKACEFYGEAFQLKHSHYPGINLAFCLLAAGQREEALDCAEKVAKSCRIELEALRDSADGWLHGTYAEALVHLGDIDQAAVHYRKAAQLFHGRWRDLSSMQAQARAIAGLLKEAPTGRLRWSDLASIQRRARSLFSGPRALDRDWLDQCFDFPSVVVFAGHMVDAPGRAAPRFPADREDEVRTAIQDQLKELKAGIGFSSAACGADLIFCECMLQRGARVNLVLPCPVDAFKLQSVSFAGSQWEKRFHAVLAAANSVLFANASEAAPSSYDPATAQALVYSNRIVTGLAALQAHSLALDLHAVTVWDGKGGDAPGGTASIVSDWRRRNLAVHVIPPPSPPAAAAAAPTAPAAVPAVPAVQQEIKAVVNAELLNYRRITEAKLPLFIREFKGRVGALLADLKVKPAVAEIWGGTHHLIFDDLEAAARFAVGFRDLVQATDWAKLGLPADLGVTIALHAGPVFVFEDAVQGRRTCVGAHVSRPARIVPVTPRGHIYASQEFAALCGAEGITVVGFEFLGRVHTTRLFEDAPLYRVDRIEAGQ
jgi:tetratricopeptide (TPR) repeat protein